MPADINMLNSPAQKNRISETQKQGIVDNPPYLTLAPQGSSSQSRPGPRLDVRITEVAPPTTQDT